MINYDAAREYSRTYSSKAYLFEWVKDSWKMIDLSSHPPDLAIPRNTNKTYCVVCNGVIMAWREPLPACTWEELEVLEDLEDGGGKSYFPDKNIENLLDRKYITKIRFAPQHWVCHITERGKEYLRYCHANMFDGTC